MLKPFGIPPASEAGSQPHSEDELRLLLRESSREGTIGREEQELSEAALVFGDLRAREVMKPRAEVDYVTTDDTPRRVAERVIETGHTRLPLCEPDGGLDAAVGVINAKDLLPVGVASPTATSTCARSRARSPTSPSRPASIASCATCAATAATSRSSTTSTARSSAS